MNFKTRFTVPLLAAAISSSTFLNTSFDNQAWALDTTDKAAIEKIVRDYLLNNPQILGEMQEAQQRKEAELLAASQKKALSEKSEIIFSSKYQIEIGNKDAKYKVVEFYDYNCPFCQRAMGDMKKVLKANPDVKFVIKEWPVLGQSSFEAHNVSIAFNSLMPEKYAEFHETLLDLKGQKGESTAIELAKKFGVDETALRAEMAKPYVLAAMRENNDIAQDLGITGTPSYIIGDEVVFGAVGFDQINSRIQAMKKK